MTLNFRLSCVILLTMLLISCTKNKHLSSNPGIIIDPVIPVTDTLTGVRIDSIQGTESHLECLGNYLVITSDRPHSYISLMSLHSDSVIASFGDKGRARNEFIDIPRIPYMSCESNRLLYCQDGTNKVTKVINLTESIRTGTCIVDTVYNHININQEHTTFLINPSVRISKHDLYYDDPRDNIFYPPYFLIYKGEETLKIDIFPKLIKTDLSSLYFIAYADMLRIKPDCKKIIQVFSYMDLFGILDIETGKYQSYMMKESYDFSFFEQIKTIDEAYKKICLFNIDVCATDKYIILLRDERRAQTFEENDKDKTGSEICIFDWNANYIKSLYVPEHITDIAFSDQTNVLYGLTPDGILYKYK